MKPLNPFLYLKYNFKSVLPIFFSLIIGVLFIYFFALFSATTHKMIRLVSFDVMEKINIVYTDDNTFLPGSLPKKINSFEGSNPIAVQMNLSGLAYYSGGMGGTTMLTLNLFDDDVPALLDSCKIRLVDGTLPKNNSFEILVPLEYALQNNLSVGDYIGTAVSDECSLQGKYSICGLTSGNVVFSVSCQPGSKSKEEIMNRGLLYRVDSLSSAKQKDLLSSLPDNTVAITYDYYEQAYAITLNSMKLLTYILTAAIIVILCIALGNLNVILFSNRKDEFTILHLVGFTKGKICRKIWLENLLICMGGYLIGIVLTQIVAWVFKIIILSPQGKILELISLNGILAALSMPVFVSIFSLLPCFINDSRYIETEY